MEMPMQLQGYYENGNYVLSNSIQIPRERTRVTVIFHDVEDIQNQKVATVKGILSDALKAESNLTDIDWDEMRNLRAQTNAGLSMRMKL